MMSMINYFVLIRRYYLNILDSEIIHLNCLVESHEIIIQCLNVIWGTSYLSRIIGARSNIGNIELNEGLRGSTSCLSNLASQTVNEINNK